MADHEGRAPFYPFRVDTWVHCSRRHFFLTHAHLDHTRGIAPAFAPIFCTPLTARLVLLRCPQMHLSAFSLINIEEPRLIQDDRDGSFTVTAYDANHCPGAAMFLFEGAFGTVLHTGDCRLTAECCARLPRQLFGGLLDCLFLDCTFGKESVRMPSREEAISQVKQCIWNHPNAPIVYLACDLLGQEMLLRSLSCAFGFKIYVDKNTLPDFYGSLCEVAPDLITDDPKATRFHVCEGFPRLYERAKAKFSAAHAKNEQEPLFIRPSAQWYTYGERLEGIGSGLLLLEKLYEKAPPITRRRIKSAPTEAERDPLGIWHVCYSMHSSQEELELFITKLKPKQVVSTTPHCKATELSYVKALRHSAAPARAVSRIISLPGKRPEKEIKNLSDKQKIDNIPEPLAVELRSPTRHMPLFGMAVAGLIPSPPLSFNSSDSLSVMLENSTAACSPQSSSKQSSLGRQQLNMPRVQCADSPVHISKAIAGNAEVESTGKSIDMWGSPKYWRPGGKGKYMDASSPIVSCMGNSYGLGETTRRTYRSLNMIVPMPLPSLVELDREIKRGRF